MSGIDPDGISLDILMQLREEFLGHSQTRVETLDACIASLLAPADGGADCLVEFRREVHNLKGAGGSFGFPSISLIAHRLEDYLSSAGNPTVRQLGDLQVFVDRLSSIIDDGVEPDDEATNAILRLLPVHTVFDPSEVVQRDVEVLLVIPSRAIGHIVSRELQACGYRVITAQTPSVAFDMVVKMRPDMIIASAVLNPVSGIDLVRAFTAMTLSENIPIAVLTSFAHNHQDILRLPAGTAIIRLDEHLKDDLANVIVEFEQRLEQTAAAVAGKT